MPLCLKECACGKAKRASGCRLSPSFDARHIFAIFLLLRLLRTRERAACARRCAQRAQRMRYVENARGSTMLICRCVMLLPFSPLPRRDSRRYAAAVFLMIRHSHAATMPCCLLLLMPLFDVAAVFAIACRAFDWFVMPLPRFYAAMILLICYKMLLDFAAAYMPPLSALRLPPYDALMPLIVG